MTWQEKHDIIINWIDSCKTCEQLSNMLEFVKKQSFDKSKLLFFCRMKAYSLYANVYYETLTKIIPKLQ